MLLDLLEQIAPRHTSRLWSRSVRYEPSSKILQAMKEFNGGESHT